MATGQCTDHRPTLADALTAVRCFLQASLPDVARVDVSRVMPVQSGEASWEAQAVVWQPNSTVQSLGLETSHPVLDPHTCIVRLDSCLNVIAYETEEAS
ncbi:MAG: hypothetical protein ABR915_16030 [Thermoguttaceae bacterium]|jgi:hypothetical protein